MSSDSSAPQWTDPPRDTPAIYSSDNIELDVPITEQNGRPPTVKTVSTPAYQSPLRHHTRAHSSHKEVKETLNARTEYSNSEDDGSAQHRINQYVIKQEIGRGSFGSVHLAVDQYGQEYAVKEFSKTRLRKRAQSNYLRRPSVRKRGAGRLNLRPGPNGGKAKMDSSDALELIKEEIAIMKKLNHQNLVSLIEVLDDPEEDSLYMVLEICKKGVVMKVGLEDRADPYDEEQCRCWFRDMILGIEYLHAQGIIHRDIKPDNCLVTEDDVLKIVDFGVSEMFEKESDMNTAKSAGSPAFMPPELCVAKHGHVSGKAADIWSMGVTLYCLRFGRIPFEKTGMLELYDSIREEDVVLDSNQCTPELKDLLSKCLDKDPLTRITMDDIREHPWITRNGEDPLLPKAENIAVLVEPPTEEEVNAAITGNMGHLLAVMRAVKRFKELVFRKRPDLMQSILGTGSRIVQPPQSMAKKTTPATFVPRSQSTDADNRRRIETALTAEGVHRDIPISDNLQRLPAHIDKLVVHADDIAPSDEAFSQSPSDALTPTQSNSNPIDRIANIPKSTPASPSPDPHDSRRASTLPPTPSAGKGQAHDPLEDQLFLHIGVSSTTPPPSSPNPTPIVSESPTTHSETKDNQLAYEAEVNRILHSRGRSATLYLTRRVENSRAVKGLEYVFNETKSGVEEGAEQGRRGVSSLAGRFRNAKSSSEGSVGFGAMLKGIQGFAGVAGAAGGATGAAAATDDQAKPSADKQAKPGAEAGKENDEAITAARRAHQDPPANAS